MCVGWLSSTELCRALPATSFFLVRIPVPLVSPDVAATASTPAAQTVKKLRDDARPGQNDEEPVCGHMRDRSGKRLERVESVHEPGVVQALYNWLVGGAHF